MALKFRRGTTAQQSGSLAFGEPYVNTTLGTLLIGGANGDIVLSAAGTGSTGTFGELNVSGNASIGGNLTLGGAITIGDASSDSINVVASLSSSLIPSNNNAFDLGSSTYKYKDAYIAGNIVVGGTVDGVDVSNLNTSVSALISTASNHEDRIDSLEAFSSSLGNGFATDAELSAVSAAVATTISNLGSTYATDAELNSVSGAISTTISNLGSTYATDAELSAVSAAFDSTIDNLSTSNVAEGSNLYYTDARVKTKLNAEAVVSSSAQVVGILSSLNTYTGSNDTTNSTQNTAISALNSFTSSINTTIKSKLDADAVVSSSAQITISSTTGYTAFSSSLDSRISTEKGRVDAILASADANYDTFAEIVTLINSVDTTNDNAFASFYTSSNATDAAQNARLSALETETGSIATEQSAQNARLTSLEAFSGSQLGKDSTLATYTASVDSKFSTLATYTGSNDTTNTAQNARLSALETQTGSIATDQSAQNARLSSLEGYTGSFATATATLTNKTISGASNTLTNIGNSSLTNSSITIAGSSTSLGGSISAATILGAGSTTSLPEGTNLYYTDARVKTKLDAEGVISSSAQLTTTFDSRYLNTNGDGVVSGSSQIAFSGVTGTVSNAQLANSSVTVTAGSGLSGGGAVALGSSVTLTNAGVTSAVAGTGVSVSGATGAVTISIGQSVATSATPTFAGLTINGAITATGDITAYFSSDRRFKSNIKLIPNALDKVSKLNGVTWTWNDDVNEVTKTTPNTGLIAQEVQEVLPEVVMEREDGHLGLDYSKMVGLLVEAIKEQQKQIDELKSKLGL
jgi:hypothetical protein